VFEKWHGHLPVRLCGIGILPMIHGLEAHATMNRLFKHLLRNYLKTLNVLARSAATRQSESLAWEIASLRSQ
jgi:hypothetical protein